MGSPKQNLGTWGESIASSYLKRRGFVIVARHVTSRLGEIDLIARDGGQTVFVEVKLRLSNIRGEPEQAVNRKKQERLKKAIARYISLNRIDNFRLDVVTLRPGSAPGKLLIKHHQAPLDGLDF